MTARSQTYECRQFAAAGAAGIIAKPFNPMTLAALVRSHLPREKLPGKARLRLSEGAATLSECRSELRRNEGAPAALAQMRDVARALAGAGGICNHCDTCEFPAVSLAAAELEKKAAMALAGTLDTGEVESAVHQVLARIERHERSVLPGPAAAMHGE